ncbi:hypothetical protein TNCV_7971 [Trichonephila clavipes]|nr:hypothetical protein TNCV_7971 [Trichonephila clavipes]
MHDTGSTSCVMALDLAWPVLREFEEQREMNPSPRKFEPHDDWTGCSGKLVGTLAGPLLPRLQSLGPYEDSCLRKPRRLQRGPGCEDSRRSRRYAGYARGIFYCSTISPSAV